MSVFKWIEPVLPRRRKKAGQKGAPLGEGDSVTLFAIAERCRNSGQLGEAATYYEKAVCFDSGLFNAWVGLVDSLVRLDRIEKAHEAVERALQLYRLTRPFYALKALVLLHEGQDAESIRYSDISIEKDEADWYAWFVRGEIILTRKPSSDRTRNARHCFERSIELADVQWAACLWAGLVYLITHHPAPAAAYLAESAHLNPLNAFTWLKLGDTFRTLRFFDQARFYYEQALDIDPGCTSATGGLAEARASSSRISYLIDVESARARWTRMFALDRNHKSTKE